MSAKLLTDEPLHGFALYNPHLLSREELKRLFVARRSLLEALLADIRGESGPDRRGFQHQLIIGQRGMGKSTLLRRLGDAVMEDADLAKVWLPLNFPEEQYNIKNLADFYLNCLDALGDAMDRMGSHAEAESLDDEVAELRKTPTEERAAKALAALEGWSEKLKRRFILLADNADIIFERVKKEHWSLRETLAETRCLLFVGASAQWIEATYDYDAAFYDAFKSRELRGLTLEEAREVLLGLAKITNADHVRERIEKHPARLKTLHILTGGNPRTIGLLFEVLAMGDEGDIRANLERLLDRCTALYKDRFEQLPVQAQQIVHELAIRWDPALAGDIGKSVEMDVNTVSGQLSRLVKMGVVQKTEYYNLKSKKPKAKFGFQIAERFFNIWYLMRASRSVRRRLVYLVRFLEMMYSQEELAAMARRRLGTISFDSESRLRDVEMQFVYAQAIQDQTLSSALERSAVHQLVDLKEFRESISEMLDLEGEDAHLKEYASLQLLMVDLRDKVMATPLREGVELDREAFWNLLGGHFAVSPMEKQRVVRSLSDFAREDLDKLVRVLTGTVKQCVTDLDGDAELVEAGTSAIRKALFADTRNWDDVRSAVAMTNDARIALFVAAVWGAPPEAFNELEEALKIYPNPVVRLKLLKLRAANPPLLSGLGGELTSLELELGRNERALDELATLSENLGQFDRVESILRRLLQLNARHHGNWEKLYKLLAWRLGKTKEAEDALRNAIARDAGYPVLWNLLGLLLTEDSERFEEAEKAFRKAVELDPNFAACWGNLGNLLSIELGRPEEAEQAYRRAVEVNPEIAPIWNNIGFLLVDKLDRLDEAEQAYRKAVEVDPNYGAAWNNLGSLLFDKLERPEDAEEAYRKAVKIDPKDGASWGSLGNLLGNKLKRPEEAEKAYRKALEVDPRDASTWCNLGILLADKLGRPVEAEEAFRKSVEIDPNLAEAWNNLGILLADKFSRPEEAEEAYREAVEIDPNYAQAWTNLGALLDGRLMRPEEAERAYRKAVKADPKDALTWCDLGTLLAHKLNRPEEAEADFCKAAEADPNLAEAWNSLGALLAYKLDRPEEAEESYRKAVEIDPGYALAWTNLGSVLDLMLDRPREAEEAYRKAVEIDPNFAWAWTKLGDLWFNKLKRSEEAGEAYRRAVAANPKHAWAWNGLAWLLYKAIPDTTNEAVNAARTAIELEPIPALLHTAACVFVKAGLWLEGRDAFTGMLEKSDEEFFEAIWIEFLELIRACVAAGRASDALQLIVDAGKGDQWNPLVEALRAVEVGDREYLLRLAPEVRQPAGDIYDQITSKRILTLPAPKEV
jgi:tetratricopeptide (TPR) repeat protein